MRPANILFFYFVSVLVLIREALPPCVCVFHFGLLYSKFLSSALSFHHVMGMPTGQPVYLSIRQSDRVSQTWMTSLLVWLLPRSGREKEREKEKKKRANSTVTKPRTPLTSLISSIAPCLVHPRLVLVHTVFTTQTTPNVPVRKGAVQFLYRGLSTLRLIGPFGLRSMLTFIASCFDMF